MTHVSGIDYVPCEDSSRPLIVGERTNVTGSKKFRELIMAKKFEEAAEIGRKQMKAGAHILDVNIQHTEIDELPATGAFLEKLIRMVKTPLVIDTTNPSDRVRPHLQPGKAIINSINLARTARRSSSTSAPARRYGAAVIVGCIDEKAAISTDAKLAVADRSYRPLTEKPDGAGGT